MDNETLTLRPVSVALQAALPAWQQRLAIGLGLATLLVVAAMTLQLVAISRELGASWDQLLAGLAERKSDLAGAVLCALIMLGQWVYRSASSRRERLELRDGALRYRSPFGGALNRLFPDWQIRIADIRSARIVTPRIALFRNEPVLELRAGTQRRRIRLLGWTDPSAIDPKEALGLQRNPRRRQHWAAQREAMLPYLRRLGVRIQGDIAAPDAMHGRTGFDLAGNRASHAALFVLFGAGLYFLLDTFFINSETYVEPPDLSGFVAVAVATAAVTLVVLRKARVPVLEATVLGALLGVAVGAAGYPLLLRVNQLTSAGSIGHDYMRAEGLRFIPRDQALPEIVFSENEDYWTQFPAETVHRFQLRTGALGFYQIDMAPIWQDMRRFYQRSG